MPRHARRRSNTGIYHIMLRGINKQKIFYDKEDHNQFLFTLSRVKKEASIPIYAYCLMNNHIHLLIKEGNEPFAHSMKRFGASFVYWYNKKYERCGHLFQDRFRSETVENDQYLLVVMRYIHQNPVKAAIVENLTKYPWSSYHDYIKQGMGNYLTDIDLILSVFDQNRPRALEKFIAFNMKSNQDLCLEEDSVIKKSITDDSIRAFIFEQSGLKDLRTLKFAEPKQKELILRKLTEAGATIRQLERLTSISRSVISRATQSVGTGDGSLTQQISYHLV
jgi:putative transposase